VGGAYFLTQTYSLTNIDNMSPANTAKALSQNNIGTAVNHAKRLKGSRVRGHGALDKIIANLCNPNIQLLADGPLINAVVDNLYIRTMVPNAAHIKPLLKLLSACI
jgi:hypothetical protein